MYKIKTWEKFMEALSKQDKMNAIHVPDLDIYEQMNFLYDIVGKEHIDVSCKFYTTKDGKKVEHNLVDNFLHHVTKETFDYNLAILIKCEQFMDESEFESTSESLKEFCEHLKFSVGNNYQIFYKIRHERRRKLIFYVYIVDMEHKLRIRHDKERLMTDIRKILKDYKVSENGDLSIKIEPTNFMFNAGAQEEVTECISKLKKRWNLSNTHVSYNSAYVSLDYPIGGKFLNNVTKNFGLEDAKD